MASLVPGIGPTYDASKQAVGALTEDLYTMTKMIGFSSGSAPPSPASDVVSRHAQRAIDEGMTPP
jgi:hypothetical protein